MIADLFYNGLLLVGSTFSFVALILMGADLFKRINFYKIIGIFLLAVELFCIEIYYWFFFIHLQIIENKNPTNILIHLKNDV